MTHQELQSSVREMIFLTGKTHGEMAANLNISPSILSIVLSNNLQAIHDNLVGLKTKTSTKRKAAK